MRLMPLESEIEGGKKEEWKRQERSKTNALFGWRIQPESASHNIIFLSYEISQPFSQQYFPLTQNQPASQPASRTRQRCKSVRSKEICTPHTLYSTCNNRSSWLETCLVLVYSVSKQIWWRLGGQQWMKIEGTWFRTCTVFYELYLSSVSLSGYLRFAYITFKF